MSLRQLDEDSEDRTQSGRRSSQDAAEPAGEKLRSGTANAKAAVSRWFCLMWYVPVQ